MRVRVLYFAAARDVTGHGAEDLVLPPAVNNLGTFATWLFERYPALLPHRDSLRFAINEAFADPTDVLADGDVLAVIPPVAGG
jgi:molybdopterin converting factor subunit 1